MTKRQIKAELNKAYQALASAKESLAFVKCCKGPAEVQATWIFEVAKASVEVAKASARVEQLESM